MPHDELRVGRFSAPGQVYLITTVTHQRAPRFLGFELARMVVDEMRRLDGEGWVSSMAWVLMPDHLHWMFALGVERGLGEVIKTLKARSAQRANRFAGMSGPLWQRAFHDHALREEKEILPTARYIIANPLRAGLVERVGDYPHWDAVWL